MLKSSTWALIISTIKQEINNEFFIHKITAVCCVPVKKYPNRKVSKFQMRK